jgi:hypothetical protein
MLHRGNIFLPTALPTGPSVPVGAREISKKIRRSNTRKVRFNGQFLATGAKAGATRIPFDKTKTTQQ